MTAWRVARLIVLALILVVLSVSGAYLIIYLYRWEWNRALISGLFFVAALVVFSTTLILRSLRQLGDRIERLEGLRSSDGRDMAGTIGTANDQRSVQRFDWLREPPRSMGVFIPVLLGTGVLLTFAAYVLERLAGVLAGPTLDRRTSQLLDPDLPLGTGPMLSAPAWTEREPPAATRVGRAIGWTVAVLVFAVLLAGAIDTIQDATESRPEDLTPGGSTTVDVHIDQRRDGRPAEIVAEVLWIACRGRLPRPTEVTSIVATGDHDARLTIDRELGRLSRRRFFGCLEDFTIEFVQADVTAYEVTPA